MSQENVEVVYRCFELLDRDGPAALDEILGEFCDPEVGVRSVGRLPDRDTSARGREAVKRWFTDLCTTLDLRLEPDEFIDAGELVVVVFRQIGRGRVSGVELTSRFAFVYGLRDKRVTCMEGYRTKRESLEAVGLSE
jgi:ketosteroid isomerase-like protein